MISQSHGYLGHAYADGVAGSVMFPNAIFVNAWVCRFTVAKLPADADFEVHRAALRGPGGYVLMYVNDKLVSVCDNGRMAVFSPKQALFVCKGEEITLHWSVTTAPAPRVWLYMRQPEIGRL